MISKSTSSGKVLHARNFSLYLKFRGKEGWDLKSKQLFLLAAGVGWGVAIPAADQRFHQLLKDQDLKTAVIYKIIKGIIWRKKKCSSVQLSLCIFLDRGNMNYRHGHGITACSVSPCPLLHKGFGGSASLMLPLLPPPLGPALHSSANPRTTCSGQEESLHDHSLVFLLRNPLPPSFSAL